MAQKPLRSITFPGLSDVYTVPEGGSGGNISSVNGQTGAVKTSWYFEVTGSVASPTTTQTVEQIVAAQAAGFAPICKAVLSDFNGLPATLPALLISNMACVFGGIGSISGDTFYLTVMIDGAGNLTAKTDDVAAKGDIPKALKNPNALNIKIGNTTTSYDGSAAKTVEIPDGGTGKDGITPTIGENGNWYLGDEDTGKPSRGATGPQGAPGPQGETGPHGPQGPAGVTPDIKIGTVTTLPAGSAATASMGGTAAQPTLNLGIPKGANGDNANVTKDAVVGALGFTPIGADDVPVKKVNGATGEVKSTFYVTITIAEDESISADKTLEEIYTAYEKGYAVYAKTADSPQIIVPLTIAVHSGNDYAVVFNGAVTFGDTTEYAISNDGSGWTIYAKDIAFKDNIPTIPTALKNPYSLNIKIGDTTTSYDGSAAKTVEIPNGVPSVTTADNGKILRVVNGAWAAVEIANANGGSF